MLRRFRDEVRGVNLELTLGVAGRKFTDVSRGRSPQKEWRRPRTRPPRLIDPAALNLSFAGGARRQIRVSYGRGYTGADLGWTMSVFLSSGAIA